MTTKPDDPVVVNKREHDGERSSAWRHFSLQNAPLILSMLILAGTLIAYVTLYKRELHKFPTNFDWTSLVNTALPLVFAAVGQSFVVLTRGIDLSVGGMMDISNSLAAVHLRPTPASMIAWSVVILLVGAAGGLVNGLLVAYARLQPILVTLATLSIYQGLALRVLKEPGGAVPPAYTNFLTSTKRPSGLLLVALAGGLWWVFRRTRFGMGVFALGNDEVAARANGIAVRRLKVWAYVLAGLFAAAGGLLMTATRTGGDATAGTVYTLTSIAAVVLGGISFLGGRGSAIGAICGAFALTLVENVLFFAHIEPLYTPFYQGLFLIIAVLLGSVAGRLARGRTR
ncbi:MAG: ABC transporter permease [Actinomycetota bacterium]